MANTTDQIAKQTVVARLSISLYKMNLNQLATILSLLEDESGLGTAADVADENDTPAGTNQDMRRQMIIARIFILIKQLDKDALLQRLRPFDHPDFRWVREYPRLSCYLQVDFAAGGKAYQSYIRDLSAGGVFIETKDAFKVGQEVSLCFTLSESDAAMPFKLKGKVTRVYPDGIGVQYLNMSKYQRQIINTLIEKRK